MPAAWGAVRGGGPGGALIEVRFEARVPQLHVRPLRQRLHLAVVAHLLPDRRCTAQQHASRVRGRIMAVKHRSVGLALLL
eukprot:3551737-Rhodomonas_salina.2